MTPELLIQALIDGILIGGVYAAIGLGLSIAYGVMGVTNWAHGEVLMVALYISIYLTKYAGFDPYLTALVNIVVMPAVNSRMSRQAALPRLTSLLKATFCSR